MNWWNSKSDSVKGPRSGIIGDRDASVAQLVECLAFNQLVASSNPAGGPLFFLDHVAIQLFPFTDPSASNGQLPVSNVSRN
jgi:hypothetical protein